MKHRVVGLLMASGAIMSGSAMALENQITLCTSGANERKVEVVYEDGMATPCEVQYTKASGMQVLWRASSEVGFCEDKAAGLVDNLVGWGWDCGLVSDVEPAPLESESREAESLIDETAIESAEDTVKAAAEEVVESAETMASEMKDAAEIEPMEEDKN